jgi:hypothetical protein
MIRKFTSIRQTIDTALDCKVDSIRTHMGKDWYNNESSTDTFRLAAEGDTTCVPAARAMLSKLETQIPTPKRIWERAPVGVFTAVPEFVAGFPTPMRRLVSAPDEHSPITIYVNTTSSSAIDAQTMTERGTVILALVMALIRTRPTRLYLLNILHGVEGGETVFAIPVPTAPLDLARACYTLTSVGYARRMLYGLATKLNGFNGKWPKAFNYSDPKPYYDGLLVRLGADTKSTLLIPAAQLGDLLLSDPLKWIKTQIDRFTPNQEQ